MIWNKNKEWSDFQIDSFSKLGFKTIKYHSRSI